jgi:integrase
MRSRLINKGMGDECSQNTSEHSATGLNQTSRRKVVGKKLVYPKTDSRFWLPRLFRWAGSPNYSIRVQFRGRELSFSLRTGNRESAAKRAAKIFADLVDLGIEATIAKHRAPAVKAPKPNVTIGDWISAVSGVFDGKPATFGGYARGLRFIASEILAVSKSKKRYGRAQSNNYRRQVDAAPLSIFTPEAIQAWRIRYVKRAGENPARQRSARISCNAAIRQARSLFSHKILGFIDAGLVPTPLPFSGTRFYPRESMRYQSRIDPAALLQSAKENLFESDPEAFKALLLALGAGLRRGEIDRLLWRQIDFTAGVIHVEATEAGGLKTEESAGTVPIDIGLVSFLRGFQAKACDQYVLGAGSGITASKPWGQRYRCAHVFARLVEWLKSQDVEVAKPIHTLRKEAGSIVATKAGIHAASQFLRHADIQVTSMHYADHKERVVVEIGALLNSQTIAPLTLPTTGYEKESKAV